MYCPQCGTTNKDGVNFCMNCGHCFNVSQPSAKIIISREKKTIGSIQNHEIYLNGNYIGILKNGGTLEIQVEYGTHIVEFKSSMKSMGQSSKVTVYVSEENPITNVYAKFEMNGNFEIAGAKQSLNNTTSCSNVINDIKYTIKGINGQLYVYENKVEIKRKGVFAFANHGLKGDKTIPISSIRSIQIKKAGLTAGYIQFGIGGSLESRGGLQAANYDENTVTFGNADNKTATQIKEYIESLMYNNSNLQGNVIQTTSDADELLKFKKLLDDGVITQEEFDAKKKQLLGL